MKSRDSSLIPSPFPGVLCPAIPGCWLRAGRCEAPPSSHAGCVVPLALGMHSQPGNRPLQPCTSPSAGCVAGVASSRHRPRPPVPASGAPNASVRWAPSKWVKSAWEKLREGRRVLKWITALGGWRWNLFEPLFQLNLSQHLIWVSCKNN